MLVPSALHVVSVRPKHVVWHPGEAGVVAQDVPQAPTHQVARLVSTEAEGADGAFLILCGKQVFYLYEL